MADEADSLLAGDGGTDTTDKAAVAATTADAGKAADKGDSSTAEADAGTDKAADASADDWRAKAAAGNEDILKTLSRYNSVENALKALHATKQAISRGEFQRAKPDGTDEKALAAWKKEQGIPDKPEGYVLPEDVTKLMTDADKPVLASFTEFAHSQGARPDVVEIASRWYVQQAEAAAVQQMETDKGHKETLEDDLRGDWGAEYKSNFNLAKRFLEDSPLGAKGWAGLRSDKGVLLGNDPDFMRWAAEQGREKFGDSAFASPDSVSRHESEKAEIERMLKTDRKAYFRDGWDKKYAAVLEREAKRPA